MYKTYQTERGGEVMKKYIDADELKRKISIAQASLDTNDDEEWNGNRPYYKSLALVNSIIDEQPAADVVEVVRCKNCEYRGVKPRCDGRHPGYFCADGKRRSE